jgi:hypothetical protein
VGLTAQLFLVILAKGGDMSGEKNERELCTYDPKTLYFGTPVALVSSLNEDGTTDLAPLSSFWARGWTLTKAHEFHNIISGWPTASWVRRFALKLERFLRLRCAWA